MQFETERVVLFCSVLFVLAVIMSFVVLGR